MFTPGRGAPGASTSTETPNEAAGGLGGLGGAGGAGNLPMGGFESIFQSYIIMF